MLAFANCYSLYLELCLFIGSYKNVHCAPLSEKLPDTLQRMCLFLRVAAIFKINV